MPRHKIRASRTHGGIRGAPCAERRCVTGFEVGRIHGWRQLSQEICGEYAHDACRLFRHRRTAAGGANMRRKPPEG